MIRINVGIFVDYGTIFVRGFYEVFSLVIYGFWGLELLDFLVFHKVYKGKFRVLGLLKLDFLIIAVFVLLLLVVRYCARHEILF